MILDLVAIVLIGAVAAFDIMLELSNKQTISEWYQTLLPTWVDVIIMLGVLAVLIAIWPRAWLPIILAAASGHVFWANKERYHG